MSLSLKPEKYYRPLVLSDDEFNQINNRIVNSGPIRIYDDNLIQQIKQNLLQTEPQVYFVPINGKYHDIEYDWLMIYTKKTDEFGCHYYSGLIPFDRYYHFYGPEEKGSCCDGKDGSCGFCNNIIVLKRWWKKFHL